MGQMAFSCVEVPWILRSVDQFEQQSLRWKFRSEWRLFFLGDARWHSWWWRATKCGYRRGSRTRWNAYLHRAEQSTFCIPLMGRIWIQTWTKNLIGFFLSPTQFVYHVSSESVRYFLRYPAHRQTNRGENTASIYLWCRSWNVKDVLYRRQEFKYQDGRAWG